MFVRVRDWDCRLTTYRHRFARAAALAPPAKRNDVRFIKNRGRASPVKVWGWVRVMVEFVSSGHLLLSGDGSGLGF